MKAEEMRFIGVAEEGKLCPKPEDPGDALQGREGEDTE